MRARSRDEIRGPFTEEGRACGGGKKVGYTNEIFIDAVNRFVSASAGTAGAVQALRGGRSECVME